MIQNTSPVGFVVIRVMDLAAALAGVEIKAELELSGTFDISLSDVIQLHTNTHSFFNKERALAESAPDQERVDRHLTRKL